MKRGMTIEYLTCRADHKFEVDFGAIGAIGTIVTKWDLIVFGQCINFIHNIYIFKYAAFPFNPIRSGLFQTANDPGGGGALKAPPPPTSPTISKTIVSIFTISYMCILPGVLGMFQFEFFKNSRF